jgi:hypothetical protein
VQPDTQDVKPLFVAGIDADLPEVKRPGTQVVYLGPGIAVIVRPKDAARVDIIAGAGWLAANCSETGLIGLNDRVEHGGIASGDGQAATPQRTPGEAAMQFEPGFAAIDRLVDSGFRSELNGGIAAGEFAAPALVGSHEQGIRIGRIHDQIDDAGVLIDEGDLVPGSAAIGGLEKSSLSTGPPKPPQHSDVNNVRIVRVDENAADVGCVLEADMLPGGPGVD